MESSVDTGSKDEIWRPIKGFEGQYSISDLGRVFSHARNHPRGYGSQHNGKTLKPYSHKGFYPFVNLWKNGKCSKRYMHRLMFETFVPKLNKGELLVNHKNGIKTDFRLENLEWVTCSENHNHAWKTGLKKVTQKMRDNMKKNRRIYG